MVQIRDDDLLERKAALYYTVRVCARLDSRFRLPLTQTWSVGNGLRDPSGS
jgi:hypothetical protein